MVILELARNGHLPIQHEGQHVFHFGRPADLPHSEMILVPLRIHD